ncbi:MAG: hypothetical protein R2695_08210 [Acidimicrobiales bacterium]
MLTDVGNQATGAGTGQLMLWFPPADGWHGEIHGQCNLDTAIATAQQVAIDGDDVLVASARPPTVGVWRYSNLPTSADECGRPPTATVVRRRSLPPGSCSSTPPTATSGSPTV